MQITKVVRCPYCGTEDRHSYDGSHIELAICDTENGGCDKWFIIRWKVNAEAEAKKIQGEEAQ